MQVVIMRGSFQPSETSNSIFKGQLKLAFEATNENGFDCVGVVLNPNIISADILPTLDTIFEVFSEGLKTYGVVIFTSCTSDEEREEHLTYMKTVDANLARKMNDLFKHVNERVVVIDNANEPDEKLDQVQNVIQLLKDMKKKYHRRRLTVDQIQVHAEPPPVMGRKCDMNCGLRSQSSGTSHKIAKIPDLRILLIGPSGHGKSETANSLLGLTKGDERAFLSKMSTNTVTVKLQKQTAQINGRFVEVYESPAFSRDDAMNKFTESLHEAIVYSGVGFNCIAFVVQPARMCPDLIRTIAMFVTFLGRYSDVFASFIFTYTTDQVERDMRLAEMKDILSNQKFENAAFMTELFVKCSKNVMIIENKPENPQMKVDNVTRIWCTVGENFDKCFKLENFFEVLENAKEKASIQNLNPYQYTAVKNSVDHEGSLRVKEEMQQVKTETEMFLVEKSKKTQEFKSQTTEKKSKFEMNASYQMRNLKQAYAINLREKELEIKRLKLEMYKKELSQKEERLKRDRQDLNNERSNISSRGQGQNPCILS